MTKAASASGGRGRLFVLSAPSGAGKTTITARLRAAGLVRLSISYTTRLPRPGETSGDSYFFISEPEFMRMREEEKFLEWAQVYGNYYGTSREWVESRLARGDNVLLEIDCQGARRIRELAVPAVMIFIAPPDMETLRQRLIARNDSGEIALQRRLAAAAGEMAQKASFDHVVINENLDSAVDEITALIRSTPSSQPQR